MMKAGPTHRVRVEGLGGVPNNLNPKNSKEALELDTNMILHLETARRGHSQKPARSRGIP